jgi:hypothetical protein
MNYRNDQFFPSTIFSDGRNDPDEKTNPPFIYPDRVVRVLAHQNGQWDQPLTSKAVTLDRGFMRNLYTKLGAGETLPKRRLNFQFNPQDIQQVVSQREGMYFSILQDPAQFLQPTAGSTSFAFDLLFDRTMEVANNTGLNAFTADLQNPTDKDAKDIGVMADLTQLFSIIGQGFSKDMLDYQTAKLKQDAKREYERMKADITNEDGSVQFTYDQQAPAALDKFASSINLGNSAFLIPQPVRIVFSSLFMVDGFISSTDVQFTKFNTNMVPIQCKVVLQVNAIYIGFARDKTFLTNQLDQSKQQRDDEQKADKDATTSLYYLAQNYLNKMVLVYSDNIELIDTDFDSGYASHPIVGLMTKGWVGPGYLYLNNKEVSNPTVWARLYTSADNVPDGNEEEPIRKLFRDGEPLKIEYTVFVDLYGPYDTQALADTASQNLSSIPSTKKVGQYSFRRTIANEDEWVQRYTANVNDPIGGRSNSVNSENQSQYAMTLDNYLDFVPSAGSVAFGSDAELYQYLYDNLKNKYFIIYSSARAKISRTSEFGDSVIEKFSSTKAVRQGSYGTNAFGGPAGMTSLFFDWVDTNRPPDRLEEDLS